MRKLPVPESVKDVLFRKFKLYPPNPPSDPPVGELTPQMRKQIEDLNTVCLFLGPNRNLTTLTASVLALHPNCQVMSHGGIRIFPVEQLNFLENYTEEKFINFCQFLLVKSLARDKGSFGGSITITHAFRYHKIMEATFRRRYGRAMSKDRIECLVWKEAHRTDDFVAEKNINLEDLLLKNKKIRLMMPIRNPIDVAFSYFTREKFRENFFPELDGKDITPILETILNQMARVVRLHQAHPDRVMIFFEDEINESLFVRMASFLKIPAEPRWIRDALKCFRVQDTEYQTPENLTGYFQEQISSLFKDSPQMLARFNQYLLG